MKKRHASILLLTALFLFTASGAQAAGRLNFMLTNLSGMHITDVRIAPTYYSNYQSNNLLKTNLDPGTRLYIGPNFYGDQRYWNISLTWSNGYRHTWTHSQLARYNSYVVYPGPYGVRMRQGFEPSFARYGDGPALTMYSGAQPGVSVSVGIPEKANVATAPAAATQTAPNALVADSTRRTRDLVFDDDDKAPATSAEKPKGETIAVKATVELNRDGKTSTVLPSEEFKSGDKVRLLFSSNRDGYVYWVAKGTSGSYQVLFPSAKTGMDNSITKNKEYTVPMKGAWRFDDKKGTETLVCFVSPSKVANLDNAVQLAAQGKGEEASGIIAGQISGHETKRRATRDLVFEEEDEKDVNTKTQVSPGNEPFVATYELIHN